MNAHALSVLEFGRVIALLESHATSGLGKRQARQVEPSSDRERVARLIAETTELRELLAPACELPIGGLHDLFPHLDRLQDGAEVLAPEEILLMADTLRAGRQVRAYLEEAGERCPRLQAYAAAIGTYAQIEERIAAALGETGAIRNTASAVLRSLRRQIEQLRGRIRAKLQSLLRSSDVAPYLQDTGIREVKGRPALAVRAQHAARVAGARRDRSDSGSTVFVEPAAVRPLVDELETALDAEKAEMRRILAEITAMIAARQDDLRRTLAALAHVDLTYAKVRLSRAFAMHPPRLNEDGVVRLDQARHPLLLDLQRCTGQPPLVVPIDVRLGEGFDTLIITGPNTGGKTVALKTLGLLVLMAQSGLHVPAGPASTVALFEDVLADIGDEQSLEQSLSTFSSHLRHVGQILAQAGPRTLVLMDELGGGTDPAEGAALARAILEYLHERGARTAVSTHLSDLKKLGYTVPGMENAAIEFDVETLQPTHRLIQGTPGKSNALAIARRLGLPAEVLERAEQAPGDDVTAALMAQVQAARSAALQERHCAETVREQARQREAEWRDEQAAQEARQAQAHRAQQETADRALLGLLAEVERLRAQAPSREGLLQGLERMEAMVTETLAASPQGAARQSLAAGDPVRVRSLERTGVLLELDERGRRAVVQLGSTPVRVALHDVEPAPQG
ncbi:MAG: MutS2/Smr-associated SH3 domain-containing protein [Candidatus Latescibacterota bacterium]